MARTILVTGATGGIGLETARQLAAQGHDVLLHGRDANKAAHAADEVVRRKGAQVFPVHADLADRTQIDALATHITTHHPALDTIIHNAGVYNPNRKETRDGIEATFAINHLAPFMLTQGLLDTLRANAPARIVVVASRAHHTADLDLDDIEMAHRPYAGWIQYANTKLMNILFARALANRLQDSGVTVNALHPGFVATRLARDFNVVDAAFRIFGTRVDKGAETSVYLATATEIAGRTGLYWAKKRPVTPSPAARDLTHAERLWTLSLEYAQGGP